MFYYQVDWRHTYNGQFVKPQMLRAWACIGQGPRSLLHFSSPFLYNWIEQIKIFPHYALSEISHRKCIQGSPENCWRCLSMEQVARLKNNPGRWLLVEKTRLSEISVEVILSILLSVRPFILNNLFFLEQTTISNDKFHSTETFSSWRIHLFQEKRTNCSVIVQYLWGNWGDWYISVD